MGMFSLQDSMMAVVVLVFLAALIIVGLIGYAKNWRGVPEEEVVIPPAPPENLD